jgi:hypothetical protein
MSGDTFDLPDEHGAVVISIETARRWRRREPECAHARVAVDPQYAELTCRDCQRKLNPIAWVASLAERWSAVQRMYRAAREEQARLELKRRAKCEHCGGFVRLTGNDADERRRQDSAAARYRSALETIAGIWGESLGDRAVRLAREALADPEPEGSDDAYQA